MTIILSSGLLFSTLFVSSTFGANILYIDSLASPSHYLWSKAISMALIERSHNITLLSYGSEENETPTNYTAITMEGIYDTLYDNFVLEDFVYTNQFTNMITVFEFAKFTCAHNLNTKGLETLLNYPKDFKFDLVIFDVSHGLCLYPIIKRFSNPPVVAVTGFKLPPYISYAYGQHVYSSYMPHYNNAFTTEMTFVQRIVNFISIYIEIFYRKFISMPETFALAQKRFGEDIADFEEIEKNTSLLLANIDPVFDNPIALPPNIIPIGGIHIKQPKNLPEELETIVKLAKHGIIFFSLGTNIKFNKLSNDQKSALIDGLSRFPQTILWKVEPDCQLVELPKNIVIQKWFPQNDILGHPATKLFITQGGGFSTQEAMYHGVPLVVIPFILDQNLHAHQLVQRKIAVSIDIKNITAEIVTTAVNEVLTNPIYAQNVKTVSKRYRDQPQTALDRGIFWIEYVLRHGNPDHLVSPSRKMPIYQTLNLDVALTLVLCLFLLYKLPLLIIARH